MIPSPPCSSRSVIWLLLVVPGCTDLQTTLQSLLSTPTRYVVKRGDTLGEIAKAHRVTVDELRTWNGLSGDLIEVDQILLIYPMTDGGLNASPRAASPRTPTQRRRARPSGTPAEEPEPPSRVAIRIDGLAGILDVEGPSGDKSGLRRSRVRHRLGRHGRRTREGESAAVGTGLSGSGSAESLDAAMPRRIQSTSGDDPGTPGLDAGLRMASAKPCLAGPSDVAGDYGVAVAQGLSEAQLREGLQPMTSRALSCFSGARGVFDVGLSLVVGCDGRVTDVTVTDPGGLPAATLSCVQRTLRHATFDAHARPDGIEVALPLRFEF